MSGAFYRLGAWIHRWRGTILVAWMALLILCLGPAGALPEALTGGTGSIPGSRAQRVEAQLQRDFANPYVRTLVVAMSSEQLTVRDDDFRGWIDTATAAIEALAEVRRVRTWVNSADHRLLSDDEHSTALLVGLAAESVEQEERAVPVIREVLEPVAREMATQHATLAVTGRAAITYDLNGYNRVEGQRAESKALPLTLLMLLLAFGAPIAAAVPIIVALLAATIASALLMALTFVMPISNLTQNVVAMLGLAVGIDYSLLIISHFRRARKTLPAAEALAVTVSHAGTAVVYSGATVIIGLLGMLFTPVLELSSTGLGGALAVLVAVFAAVVLVPALLAFGGTALDWPAWLARRLDKSRSEAFWRSTVERVMRRPVVCGLGAVSICLVLAYPTTLATGGFDSSTKALPKGMESRRGMETLTRIGNVNALIPIHLVVSAVAGPLSAGTLPALYRYVEKLRADPRVEQILSPVSLAKALTLDQYAMLYRNLDTALERFPEIGELFVSKDRTAILAQVVPASQETLQTAQVLADEILAAGVPPGMELEVGGLPVFYNDFDRGMLDGFPKAIAFVVGACLLLLFAAFRSFLIPVKAVVLNALSVVGGYGAVVAVFHLGVLGSLGPDHLTPVIPLTIPMMIFCITFGLSMDYEIFLLSQIKRVYDETGDNDRATVDGISRTGSVITSAAAIMIVIFGAFMFADLMLIRMLGLGLAVATLIDATLIRMVLMPAIMKVAGRWNWYPGTRPGAPIPPQG